MSVRLLVNGPRPRRRAHPSKGPLLNQHIRCPPADTSTAVYPHSQVSASRCLGVLVTGALVDVCGEFVDLGGEPGDASGLAEFGDIAAQGGHVFKDVAEVGAKVADLGADHRDGSQDLTRPAAGPGRVRRAGGGQVVLDLLTQRWSVPSWVLSQGRHAWDVMFGPASFLFWAFPCWKAPRGLILSDADPTRLLAQMRQAEIHEPEPVPPNRGPHDRAHSACARPTPAGTPPRPNTGRLAASAGLSGRDSRGSAASVTPALAASPVRSTVSGRWIARRSRPVTSRGTRRRPVLST
jgi:hypothetical protein